MIKKVVIFRISLILILVLSLVIVIKLNIENFSSIIKILRMLICTECIITFSYFIEMKRNVKKDSNDISEEAKDLLKKIIQSKHDKGRY